MKDQGKKVVIGFITYGKSTAKYLPYFLPSLKAQTYGNLKIVAIDNSEERDSENMVFVRKNFPEIEIKWTGKNLGFAKAFNLMINKAIAEGAKYFLALNPDTFIEPDLTEEMVRSISQDHKIGAIAPKILKWDFDNNKKTNIIDSYGLFIKKEHRFSDFKQGEVDKPSDENPEIFGFTGAAVLFNLRALTDVAFNNGEHLEYFDELMFMYKEDCDLSYRLRLAGWKIILAPRAVAYHDRKASPAGETNLKIAWNRLSKNRQIKKWSFLNHLILLSKYRDLPFSWRVKFATGWYQFKSIIFAVFFEQYLLKELVKLWRMREEIKKRRRQLKIKMDIREIEKFMEQ